MKAIKLMLLGIAFILLGIWGTIVAVNNGGELFTLIAIICPLMGILIVITGLGLNK